MTRLNFSPFDDRGRFYHFDKVVVQWCGKNELNLDQRYDYAYGIRTCFMHLPDGCLVRFTMMQLHPWSTHARSTPPILAFQNRNLVSTQLVCVCVRVCVGAGFHGAPLFV